MAMTRARAALRRLAGLDGVDFAARYEGRVLKDHGDLRVDVELDDTRFPQMTRVPVRTAFPITHVKVKAGARVLIGFARSDPERPFAELRESGKAVIWEAETDAGRTILVDDEAGVIRVTDGTRTIEITQSEINVLGASINLGNTGGQPVARVGDDVLGYIPAGAVLVGMPGPPGFTPNPAPMPVQGTITSGSSGVKST